MNTLSESSIRLYRKRAQYEVKRYERQTGRLFEDAPEAFVQWMIEARRRQLSSSSWRLIRASVRLFLREMQREDLVAQLEQSLGLHAGAPDEPRPKIRKRFPPEALRDMLDYLDVHRKPFDALLAAILRANVRIGLRPSEWASVSVTRDGERHWVIVRNAKNSHGRANGSHRALEVDAQTAKEVREVISLRDAMMEFFPSWADIQDKLRKRFYTVREHFPSCAHLSLYSTRHQAVADCKSAGFTQRQVADVFGHASDKTATRHYGKARVGSGRSFVVRAKGLQNRPDVAAAIFAEPATEPSLAPVSSTSPIESQK